MAQNAPNNRPPAPAYFPTSSASPLHPPTALYQRLASLPSSSLELKESLLVPPRSGKAWKVPAGCLFRLSTPEGPQVGDLNVWNAWDPREKFWAKRTMQLQGSHLAEGDRLWSCLPFMRVLCGVVKDGCLLSSVGRKATVDGRRKEVSQWGGRCHDLLGTRCDGYISNVISGSQYDYHCHSNLVRAVLPHGLTGYDVHDVVNVFQVTGLNPDGQYFMEASPATKDSFIDFFAEQDLLCALSTCPGGDLSAWGWGQAEELQSAEAGAEGMKGTCRPIKVEVWEIKDEFKEEVLRDWKRPQVSGYSGSHGISIPVGEN